MRTLNVSLVCPVCGALDSVEVNRTLHFGRLYSCKVCKTISREDRIKGATRQRVIEEAKKYLGEPGMAGQNLVQRVFVRENIEHTPNKFGVTSKVPRPHSLTFTAMEYAGKFPGKGIEHWFEWELTGGNNFDVALPEEDR